MLEEAKNRTLVLQQRMKDQGVEHAVFTDEGSIAYLAGFWGYLGIEFGRPSMVVVKTQDAPIVITPLMESEMLVEMTWIEDVRVWENFGDRTWGAALAGALGDNPAEIWVERDTIQMGSIIGDAAIQHRVGKTQSLSKGRWLKRALAAARRRDSSTVADPLMVGQTENTTEALLFGPKSCIMVGWHPAFFKAMILQSEDEKGQNMRRHYCYTKSPLDTARLGWTRRWPV